MKRNKQVGTHDCRLGQDHFYREMMTFVCEITMEGEFAAYLRQRPNLQKRAARGPVGRTVTTSPSGTQLKSGLSGDVLHAAKLVSWSVPSLTSRERVPGKRSQGCKKNKVQIHF